MKCPPRKIEIFSGTGGVGKTTLATSRALYLARQNKKVLLITIDPSKRLKQVLNLDEAQSGIVQKVEPAVFGSENEGFENNFYALLLSPEITLSSIARESNHIIENPILKTLSKPYGGLNEIMAMVELSRQYQSGEYDCIVLDTPPGKHFIDFLSAGQKIHNFFDNSFVEIFKYFGKSIESIGESKLANRFFSSLVNTGIKKLLHYLELVTGKDFVHTFVNAILSIYNCKNAFLDSLRLQEQLQDSELTNLYLVTSVEHNKLREAEDLHQKMKSASRYSNHYLAINRCQGKELHKWIPNPETPLFHIKVTMLERENKLKNYARETFEHILEFPDVIDASPQEHVASLSQEW